jgi:phosphoserine aminotransferase
MTQRVYNFNAGPAALPLPVLEAVHALVSFMHDFQQRYG